jgi:hypothetical protein
MAIRSSKLRIAGVTLAIFLALTWYVSSGPRPGSVVDEARISNRQASSFPAADEDYFRDMDGGIALTSDEVKGRNTWMVWTGGDDRFWDQLIKISFGNFDLLKILSSYPGLKFSRDSRWEYFGLVNEPCFRKAAGPNQSRYGLWVDVRDDGCAPDPFENEQKYPGVEIGARGKNIPTGSFYGYASGIVGLRLFPNPDFDAEAQKAWDPVRFYTDPSYYNSKELIRPYRVGMSCGFCHVGPNPLKPPANAEKPDWQNLSSTVGAQYFWVDRIFNWKGDAGSYIFQLMHTARPGALDTSLISTDYINNPRTMNSVYSLEARLKLAKEFGKEDLSGGNFDSKQFNDYVTSGPLASYFERPATAWVPRVQKDGSDSIGVLAALNRVYLNIGLFSEEWLLHFNPVVGGKVISPIPIRFARSNSSYWQATEDQTLNMAAFLLRAGDPHRLASAPGGTDYLTQDSATLELGKTVFAERCARCHSSKYPAPTAETSPALCKAENYLDCWNRYWAWTKTDDFKRQMKEIVAKEDFLENNFLSNDLRVPSTLLQTNLCSGLATNAIAGHIWDEFSSQYYKDLPSVGAVTVHNPVTGKAEQFAMPAGGRGYSRPATLISLWSSAPFLLNNSVGRFDSDPSTAGRMRSFDDSIRQLLWPKTRPRDEKLGANVPGLIDRIEEPTYLRIPFGYLPRFIQSTVGFWRWAVPGLFVEGEQTHQFQGTTAAGSNVITHVTTADSITTFSAGAPVSGPGLRPNTRVVVFDAAKSILTLDQAATQSTSSVLLQTTTSQVGVSIGPIPSGTPINLLAGLELAPDSSGIIDQIKHYFALSKLLWNVSSDWNTATKINESPEKEDVIQSLQGKLYSMNKCPDFVVNRGHYFGTDEFSEEPGLSDKEKEALISFLKTF